MHAHRTTPAKGYRPPSTGSKGRSVAITIRLTDVVFKHLRSQAIARGTPLAAIVRDAVAVYLRSGNGTK